MTLDRLWAEWRSTYVSAIPPGTPTGGSVFARILASGAPDSQTHVLWRGECCFSILNAFPYGSGHLLVMISDVGTSAVTSCSPPPTASVPCTRPRRALMSPITSP